MNATDQEPYQCIFDRSAISAADRRYPRTLKPEKPRQTPMCWTVSWTAFRAGLPKLPPRCFQIPDSPPSSPRSVLAHRTPLPISPRTLAYRRRLHHHLHLPAAAASAGEARAAAQAVGRVRDKRARLRLARQGRYAGPPAPPRPPAPARAAPADAGPRAARTRVAAAGIDPYPSPSSSCCYWPAVVAMLHEDASLLLAMESRGALSCSRGNEGAPFHAREGMKGRLFMLASE